MTEALLELRRVRRESSSGKPLLKDVSHTFRAGERWSVRGPTGAGKSLLLRATALLDPITAGDILYRGRSIPDREVPHFRSSVIYLHQRPVLVPGTVADNLQVPFQFRQIHHSGAMFDRGRVTSWLSGFGRDDGFLEADTADLSGGERQIVCLIRALQLDPAVLMLDEPTAALDAESATSLESLVEEWFQAAPHERCLIWVSHSQEQAARIADHHLLLRDGAVEEVS